MIGHHGDHDRGSPRRISRSPGNLRAKLSQVLCRLHLHAAPCLVTGGVDTHLDLNVAAALDGIGGLLAVAEFPATLAGHRRMLGWLAGFGPVARVGVDGTGSYGAGLARFLRRAGSRDRRAGRPSRQARGRAGKSDPLDAIEAARAAPASQLATRPARRSCRARREMRRAVTRARMAERVGKTVRRDRVSPVREG